MADRKISDLTALTTPASGDYLPIVDISEASAANKNKRITIEELLRGAPDGTAGAPGFAFESDPDSGLYRTGANGVALSTGGTGRLFITSAGNVGIGATSDAGSSKLFVAGDATAGLANIVTLRTASANSYGLQIQGNDTNGEWRIQNYYSAALAFGTGNTERARIDSSGRLLVGTSSSSGDGSILQVRSDTGVAAELFRSSANDGPAFLTFNKSRGTAATPTVVNADDRVGGLIFKGYSGTAAAYVEAARIQAFVDGEPDTAGDTTDMPGRLVFSTTADGASSPTPRATIDSSGRLLVGTSSARSNYPSSFAPFVQIEGANNNANRGFSITYGIDGNSGPILDFGKHRSTSVGGTTIVQADDQLGTIRFGGSDGTDFESAAFIQAFVDGTPGANDMPGRLVFATTADGASSPTERMRINSGGAVAIGTATPETSYMLTVDGDAPGGGAGGIAVLCDGVGDANFYSNSTAIGYHFYALGASSKLFYVENDGDAWNSNGTFSQISDVTLKQDIVDADSQWDDIKQLRVRKYRFKTDPEQPLLIGLIAQEVEQVSPGLVKETSFIDGSDSVKGVKLTVLYMKAVKALQEAMDRIEILEAKVAALEGA